jgi:tetratricopeptide (TPR) repeat protein
LAQSAGGRREEALTATGEAVEHYRKLAAARPDAFLPDLAMSLNNLGAMLSELGRREEALAASREAVTITMPLVERHPAAFIEPFMKRVGNLMKRLEESGQSAESDPTVRACIELLRAGGIVPNEPPPGEA